MALSSKLTQVYIRDKATPSPLWTYSFRVKDVSLNIGQVNYGSPYDEAIDGSLRTNIRGYRMSVNLPLNKLYDSLIKRNVIFDATLDQFLNQLYTHLVTNNGEFVQISFDATNYYDFIPESVSYSVAYTNQIARASGSLKFIGQGIITNITTDLEAPSV